MTKIVLSDDRRLQHVLNGSGEKHPGNRRQSKIVILHVAYPGVGRTALGHRLPLVLLNCGLTVVVEDLRGSKQGERQILPIDT